MSEGYIKRIDDVLMKMHGGQGDVGKLRQLAACLIIGVLHELQGAATYWTKDHIVGACQAFNANTATNAGQGAKTDWWLTLCPLRLRDAFMAVADDRNATPRNPVIAGMSFRELSRQVRDHLTPCAI